MQDNDQANMSKRQEDEYKTIATYNLDQHAVSELKGPVRELAGWYPMMPKVDEHGDSKCPFAESMYVKKYRLEQEVARRMAVLQEMRPVIGREVERCRDNAYRASIDPERLDYLESLQHCSESLTNEESDFRCVIWRQTEIVKALQEAEATLSASREKVYPLPLAP